MGNTSLSNSNPCLHVACTGLFLLLAGCSGDSGGVSRDGGSGLPGTILVDDGPSTASDGVVYSIDPATGTVSTRSIPRPDKNDESRYSAAAEFLVGASGYTPALTLGVNDCSPDARYDGDTFRPACVERMSPDGSVERLFVLPDTTRFYVAPTLSPDGTLVAGLVSPRYTVGPYSLALFTSQGDVVATQVLGQSITDLGDYSGYDWAPDNRLAYSYREEGEGTFLLLSQPGSLEPESVWEVSGDGSESIGTISVSPDGQSIAYDAVPVGADSSERDAYVLDVATGESTLVAVGDSGSPKSRLGEPEWSPDGRFLLVTYGERATGGSFVGSVLPFMMVVEWQGETVTLDPYEGIGSVLVTDKSGVDPVESGPREEWIYGTPFWVSSD